MNRWVVAAASVAMMAGLGSFNAWSVFRRPLSELYGANVTEVNTVFFVSNLVFGLTAAASAVLAGKKVDPRALGVAGALLYGLGLFSSGFAGGNLPWLYLTYGLVASVGLGLAVMAPTAALPAWFPERPGFAYGVAFVGFGAGPVVGVPLMVWLLSATGGPLGTFRVLGVFYAIAIGSAAWFVRRPSDEIVNVPPAVSDPAGVPPVRAAGDGAPGAWRLRDAARTWQVYALWAVFFLNTTAGLAILSEARVLASSVGGAAAAAAAAFVVVVSLSDVAGRLLWPALSDKVGGRGAFVAMFCLQAAAFVLMPTLGVGSFALFCALCMVVMSCYGGGYGAISVVLSSYYGTKDLGTVYAAIFSASAVAGFGAPVVLARSADLLGSYHPALYATAGLMVAGGVIAASVGPPSPPTSSG